MAENKTDIEESADVPALSENSDSNFLTLIEKLAANPDVDPDKLEKFLNLQERILNKQAEQEFIAAMALAQSEIAPVAGDLDNTQTKSRYSSLEAIDAAVRPIYTKHGFMLSFDSEPGEANMVKVLCYCSHKGGFTRTYSADMPADGKGPQGGDVMTRTHATGSAFTYAQRYLVKLIFNIVSGGDDDGNAASGSPPIDADRKEQILALIKETGSDTKEFCKFMGVDSIDEIKTRDVGRALNALNKKKAKK